MSVPAGYEKLPGRSTAHAKEALDKAKANGHPTESVLTVFDGYLIPLSAEALAEQQAAAEAAAAEAADKANQGPDIDGMKVPELDHLIDTAELDVDKSLNKPEKIAAIKAALEQKE
jgi:hypothetical protein